MTTPISKVINSFHTEFQSSVLIPESLEKEFLNKAVGDFELNLYPINYDESTDSFDYTLSNTEVTLLGKLMYKHYLSREKDRILKLNNIVGKDISLTSMAASKSEIRLAYEGLTEEIAETFHKLMDSSYS